MEQIIQSIGNLNLQKNWKIFAINFFAIFLLVLLQKSGIQGPQFLKLQSNISPVTEDQKHDVIETVKQKLQILPNQQLSLELKRGNNLIPSANAAGEYDQAKSYLVVDLDTGNILTEKNANDPTAIASLTKIMTSVVALDLASPNELFTVTAKAASKIPTKIGVIEGQKMTLEELLNALLLTSANDAAEVIREGIDQKYGGPVFIKAMNEKAKVLGLSNTSFTNPQGFDNRNHFSSPVDLVYLTDYAFKNYPLFNQIVAKDYQFLESDLNHKQFDLYNWNGLIGVYPGTYGVKIGNTGDAGQTTIVAAEREGKRVMTILLNAPTVMDRDLWASQLLDLGFSKLGLDPINITEAQLQEKYNSWKYWR